MVGKALMYIMAAHVLKPLACLSKANDGEHD
jgi:hypothetical protein